MKSWASKFTAIASASCLALAGPALADVRAGVEAWSAGDYARAVGEWTGPAAQGDADAQFNLAQAYRLGRGVETDLARAEALYAQAAAQGHLRAEEQYGLLLFQKGDRERAMPYIIAAAGRGDPRGQYLLGIAHFNGDLAARDWPRAYALLTLAHAAGLAQAAAALGQMDQHIPLSQREEAQALATALKAEADARRAQQVAAADLALGRWHSPSPAAPPGAGPARDAEKPAPVVSAGGEPASPPPEQSFPFGSGSQTQAASGPWKVQLGAFGVAKNADGLWRRLSSRGELAHRERIDRKSGSLTILLAGGYATRDEAASACAALKRSGQECLVTR